MRLAHSITTSETRRRAFPSTVEVGMYRARCFTAGLLFDLGEVLYGLSRFADRLGWVVLPSRPAPSPGELSNAELDGAIS